MKGRAVFDRLIWFGRLGLLCGGGLATWVAVVMIVQGSPTIVVRGRELFGPGIMAAYLVGGLGAGVAIALLYPFRHRAAGAMFIGTMAAIPFAATMHILDKGLALDGGDIAFILAFSIVLGSLIGIVFRSIIDD